jgi:hypothetical protein
MAQEYWFLLVTLFLWGASGWVLVGLYHRLCGQAIALAQRLHDEATERRN